ncbi:MAG TPA: FAD:protein FMN transferase [Candidatus Saccharimonadales bacterium]|nr:FAD:protein FMN transferase [Candidatus Saccharimonadales bacterium]
MPHWAFTAIGTQWAIDIFEPLSGATAKTLRRQVTQRIEVFDAHYSRFRPDSWISQIATQTGRFTLPADAKPLFDLYQELYNATDGKMTPLIGQVLVDAGYDATYSLQPKAIHPARRWEDTLIYNYPHVEMLQPALLDMGAIGKGYLVDIVAGILLDHKITSFCIDAGGDMLHRSKDTHLLEVGLEDPNDATRAIGVVHLGNQSLCGSAGSYRKWDTFHHIIDPVKLVSPTHIQAVWVTAESTRLADALTTALFFVSPEQLAQYTFEYALIYADRSLVHSPHFPATFFTTQKELAA